MESGELNQSLPSSFPQALAAINEFRRIVQRLVREVVERDLKDIASSMGIELSRDQVVDYARPFELGPSIDGENATIGVTIRRDEHGWRQYFCLGWDRRKLYCSASIWFRDADLAQKVHNGIVRTECKHRVGLEKGEVYMCRDMKADEVNQLSDCLRDVLQEWIGSWKRSGSLKRFQSKAAGSSQ